MADISALSLILNLFEWYHIVMIIALIGLIIFWIVYRKRQM